jgi:uncharacterized membrane protein YbhN (UPF0104 family)
MATSSSQPSLNADRLTLFLVVAAVLAAGALFGVAWAAGFHEVLVGLAHPGWSWLGLAVVGEIVAYLGYTAAYREIARAEQGTELEVPEAAALVATGFGAFVHGGGFALDREALRHAGLSESEARHRVLGLSALEYAVLAPAAATAALLVLIQHQTISLGLTLPWIIGVPVGAALALTALRHRERVSRWPRVGPSLGRSLRSLQLVISLLATPRRHGLAFVGTVAYWAGDIFALWCTLHAFFADTPPTAQLIVAYASGYALSRRALPLGGAGVVEALLPFSLVWLKIAMVPALLAVFAYRLVNLWLPIIPAFAGIPTLRRMERRRRRGRGRRRAKGERTISD